MKGGDGEGGWVNDAHQVITTVKYRRRLQDDQPIKAQQGT